MSHRPKTLIKPYSKNTVVELWNDPYISKQMMKYHLQTDNDVFSRNIVDIKDTVEFIHKKYKPSTLYDLGCAVGLYTNLFEQKGIDVTGIDISTNSIEYAKRQNSNVEYINANHLKYKPNKQFDFITLIYFDFCALSNVNRKVMLNNVKSMLNEDGLFMFDVWSYKFYDRIQQGVKKYSESNGLYMKAHCNVTEETIKYDDYHLILNKVNANSKKKQLEFYNWDKCFNVKEITELVTKHGLKVVDIFNNTYGDKYKEDSYSLTIVCKKGD